MLSEIRLNKEFWNWYFKYENERQKKEKAIRRIYD